jgi:hypothetical protein
MPDNLSSAVEHTAKGATIERAEVCSACRQERSDLLAEMGAIESEVEANTSTRLAEWAEAGFPELEPAEHVAAAVEAFQTDERQFDPSYDVTMEDPADIEADIRLLAELTTAETRNSSLATQIEDGVPAIIPAGAEKESPLLIHERELEVVNTEALATEVQRQETTVEKEGRTAELGDLQKAFNQLRTEGLRTADALRLVIAEAKHPDTKQRLNAILSKVALLQSALPDKPEVVSRILNTTGLNLAAATVAGSFAVFMTTAETNEELTDQDRAALRQIINSGERRLRTGTQVRNTALQTALDPATGEEKPIHTKDNKAEIAPGVFTYTATGSDVILEIHEGSLHRQIDVTGLDGQSIGIVAEIMGLSALAETSGASGFMKHVYDVDFDRITEQRFDPITLSGLSQKLSYLLGTGHDGEISQPVQRRQLLQNQMRLVSRTGSLHAWEADPDGYREGVLQLGLDQDAVLEAFGQYTQLHVGQGTISRNQLQLHLSRRFPDVVKAPPNVTRAILPPDVVRPRL